MEEETNICEECGKEYTYSDFNRMAPYAMCDKCYDDYIIENFDANEHEF